MIPRPLARAFRLPSLLLCTAMLWACDRTPELARQHLAQGDVALEAGRYPQALAAYGHARELAPTDPDVQRALMRARVHLIAESAARIAPEAIDDARYEAQLLLDTDKPRAAVYLTALGNILARQGDAEGAKAKFIEALAIDPASPLAHTALGLVLMSRKEDAARAKSEFQLALKVKPADAGALVGLGQIELAEGDIAGAAEHLEAALRIAESFDARLALGRARAKQQKNVDAILHFQRAAELDPKSADAMGSLGQALLGAGKLEDAERALRAAMQMRPVPETGNALGFALVRQKKAAAALDVFRGVLASDATSAPALLGAGIASEDLGEKEQALGSYQKLLALTPSGPDGRLVADLQRQAQSRVTALSAAPAASASASAGPAPAPRPNEKRSP
ncbi:tetratricopeptide repeat protein [Polyangium jinanense]|uniref:Tetratricopeptide repeat protein n=1 Tax=Polyangium jinanense TaxID=2829994 RepID=A0A9X4ASR2_9BACT|nr:tetratricopeptide repeat protein [Polyangium jinanense]MDC3954834.1 tetratricopeptide repeat protein [Polyangium jinanense]MDC3981395.1 tetratricopeptide repeat protein [Polyangium jinanense]